VEDIEQAKIFSDVVAVQCSGKNFTSRADTGATSCGHGTITSKNVLVATISSTGAEKVAEHQYKCKRHIWAIHSKKVSAKNFTPKHFRHEVITKILFFCCTVAVATQLIEINKKTKNKLTNCSMTSIDHRGSASNGSTSWFTVVSTAYVRSMTKRVVRRVGSCERVKLECWLISTVMEKRHRVRVAGKITKWNVDQTMPSRLSKHSQKVQQTVGNGNQYFPLLFAIAHAALFQANSVEGRF